MAFLSISNQIMRFSVLGTSLCKCPCLTSNLSKGNRVHLLRSISDPRITSLEPHGFLSGKKRWETGCREGSSECLVQSKHVSEGTVTEIDRLNVYVMSSAVAGIIWTLSPLTERYLLSPLMEGDFPGGSAG